MKIYRLIIWDLEGEEVQTTYHKSKASARREKDRVQKEISEGGFVENLKEYEDFAIEEIEVEE